jgi:hypothetical protein
MILKWIEWVEDYQKISMISQQLVTLEKSLQNWKQSFQTEILTFSAFFHPNHCILKETVLFDPQVENWNPVHKLYIENWIFYHFLFQFGEFLFLKSLLLIEFILENKVNE